MFGVLSNIQILKLKETYFYVIKSLVVTLLGVLTALQFAPIPTIAFWVLMVISIGMLILFSWKFKNGWMFYAVSFVMGVIVSFSIYAFISAGHGWLIVQAVLLTIVLFAGLSHYATSTKNNHMGLAPILFWSLVVLVIVGIINIFLGISWLSFLFSAVAVVLFSAFIIVDTQEVLYTDITPLEGAMGIYLSLINLFLNILSLLGFTED